jgi:hypothetical protein
MRIPFDPVNNVHLEHDEYKGIQIKQADVILLGFPLMYPMSTEIRENDLNFYSQVTSQYGPAMTWSMTAIGYLEILGNHKISSLCNSSPVDEEKIAQLQEKVDGYFWKSYQNAQLPFYVWTETPRGVSLFSNFSWYSY